MLRCAWMVLLAMALPGLASAAGDQLELVSRVHPSQVSDTAAGVSTLWDFNHPENTARPPAFSSDGRYVVFLSAATNMVAGQKDVNQGDGSSGHDVFFIDLELGNTTLVSRASGTSATTGNRLSKEAVISADGRFIAFTSQATNLVPGQTGSGRETGLFLFDRIHGPLSLVASSEVLTDLAISDDGRYIAFSSKARLVPGQQGPSRLNAFLYDRVGKTFRLASHTSGSATTGENANSQVFGMSADGRYVVFSSYDGPPVSLYDRTTEAVLQVGPGRSAAISANGKVIAVVNNSQLYLHDRETLETLLLSSRFNGGTPPALSADGRFVTFVSHDQDLVPGQQSGASDTLFLYDRVTRTYTLASRRHDSPTAPGTFISSHAISGDGRFVVFASRDPDLVAGQVEGNVAYPDVFLFDRLSGRTTLLSSQLTSPVTTGNAISFVPAISADGSRAAFISLASDLMGDVRDFNNGYDVFVQETEGRSRYLLTAGDPETPSLSPGSRSWGQALSADGRFVAFVTDSPHVIAGQTDSNGDTDVFLYDRTTRNTLLVSRALGSATTAGQGRSLNPVLSADGRYVVFLSNATDLAPGVDNPERFYAFLFDRVSGVSTLIGVTSFPFPPDATFSTPAVQISSDGRWVAFESTAANLVPGQRDQESTFDVFLWDRTNGSAVLVSRSAAGATTTGNAESFSPVLSADGRYTAFLSLADDLVPGQNGNTSGLNLFLNDRVTGKTVLVNHARGSATTAVPFDDFNFDMSGDGRFVVFHSVRGDLAPNVTESRDSVYVYDRTSETHQWIGLSAKTPRISADGKFIVFTPSAGISARQLHLYDRVAKSSVLITPSRVHAGQPSNSDSRNPVLSADGRYVAFLSYASDLVPGQTASQGWRGEGVFLFDRLTGTTTLVSPGPVSPATEVGPSSPPLISAGGLQVAFTSTVGLAEGDLNNKSDAYLFSHEPTGLIPLPACTLLDTRHRADRPVLTSNVQRTVTVRGACGVPVAAKQVVVKVTVLNPSGKGNLRFYPGAVTATPSGILRFERNATRTETFTLPLSTNGSLTILPFVAGKGTVHVAVEVTGYAN